MGIFLLLLILAVPLSVVYIILAFFMSDVYARFWEDFDDFSGRSNRSEYWKTYFLNLFLSLVLFGISMYFFNSAAIQGNGGFLIAFGGIILPALYGSVTFLPTLSLTVRRLRDAGYKWPWLFVSFLPLAGPIWLCFLLCLPTGYHRRSLQ